ncbi:hypothetical protein LSAT2_019486 [Lamellibrachia satsuma]|nr:hypothetical protein LSAT2_019486 [Lamellibrachia satsuma]
MGRDEIESTICTSNSDCDYVHGVCFKFDQCDKGRCRCDVGYELDYYDMKKDGEFCFDIFDTCELGSECGSDGVCVPKNTTITTEKIFTTGLYDEPCIDSHNCWGSQKCLSGKCGCTSDKQRIKVYNDTAYYRKYIVPITDSCIDKNVELTLKKNDACSTDKLTDKYCGQLMPCGRCPEWSTTDNARCLSRSPTTNPSAAKKIGESCVPQDVCAGRATCKNNSCSCEDHGSTPSDDMTQCGPNQRLTEQSNYRDGAPSTQSRYCRYIREYLVVSATPAASIKMTTTKRKQLNSRQLE